MKNNLFFPLVFILFCGCAKLEHLDQLLTLKDLSEEGDRLDKYVETQDKKFDLLVAAVKNETLKRDLHKNKILKTYGDPVYTEDINRNEESVEQWLYRYTKNFFNGEKVYLYFNDQNKLINWEYIPPAVVKTADSQE